MNLIGYLTWIFIWCSVSVTEPLAWLKRSKTGENPADLDEWQSLLFADGNNPLDKIESSSSSDESEEEDARPVEVFQTKFPSKQSNEVERPASRITANRVSRATAEYFTNELASLIKNEWQGQTIQNFELKILQLNLTVSNVKILKIDFPEIRYERPNSDTLQLIGSGGFAHVRSNYKSEFRTTRRGQIEVFVNGLNIDLTLRFQRSQSRNLSILEMICRPVIARLEVKITPFLIDEVKDAVQKTLWLLLQREICSRAEDYVRRTDDKFQESGHKTPFDTKASNL